MIGIARQKVTRGWFAKVLSPGSDIVYIPDSTWSWVPGAFEDVNGYLSRLRTPAGYVVINPIGKAGYFPDDPGAYASEPPPVVMPPPTPPTPVDPPPLPPAPTGGYNRPSLVQNMTETSADVWESDDAWRSDVAAFQINLGTAVGYGKTITLTFERKANYPFLIAGKVPNVKLMRCWKGSIPSYPNWYLGSQSDGGWLFNSEKIAGLKDVVKFYTTHYPAHISDWRAEEWIIKYNSAVGRADGHVKITVGGLVLVDKGGWQSDSAAYPGCPSLLCIQDDPSNVTLPGGSYTKYRKILVSVS